MKISPIRFSVASIIFIPCVLQASDKLSVQHQQSDMSLTERIEADRQIITRLDASIYTSNPAQQFFKHNYSLSTFGIRGEYNDADEPVIIQEGTGSMLGNVEASSYLLLNKHATVWGHARFTTGKRHDILWNNSSDYTTTAPYVLADSVGGDLSTRQYSFGGGYAGRYGRITWGAEAGYTATIDYRNRDPRDKIVVSDLTVRLGAAYSLNNHYNLGISGGLRVYNQESDIDFYNPVNDIRIYAMTGIGTTYQRFSGNSAENTAYKGLGASASAEFLPALSADGIRISATFNYLKLNQILRDFNNLDLTTGHSYSTGLRVGYTGRCCQQVNAGVYLSGHFKRKIGFENIFGSSVGNTYAKIGSRQNYYADNISATMEIPVEITLNRRTTLSLLPGILFGYDHENYRSPSRALESHCWTPLLDASVSFRPSEKLSMNITAICSQRMATADREKLTGLDCTTAIGQMVSHNFDMLTANATTVGGRISADILIDSGMALTIAAGCNTTSYKSHGNYTSASVAVYLSF